MVNSVPKRRQRSSRNAQTETTGTEKSLKDSRFFLLRSIFFGLLLTILFLLLVYLWSTSTTVISGNVVHLCLSWRKLNDLYCFTTDSHPRFHQPVNNFTKPVSVAGKDRETGFVNETVAGKSSGESVSDDPKVEKSLNSIQNETFSKNEENLDSFLDQDSELKNEINLHDWYSQTEGEEQHKYIKPKDEKEETALKAMYKYLRLQRTWLSTQKEEKSGSCDGNWVYVYDLPSKFNTDLLGECGDVRWTKNFCSYFKNNAFGESIESLGNGWFRTHQFALEPIFHNRVLNHPCRVYDESQAKLFYVPFYGGIDVLRWHFKNVSHQVMNVLGNEMIKWLESKKSWRRNSGKDHVFVLGKISWDFKRNNQLSWGSNFLDMQEMQNTTKLLIERNPWEINEHAIPYPSFFHPKTDEDIASWQNKIIGKPRRSLISFAGSIRPGNPDIFRSNLITECASLPPNQCRFLNCTDGGCDKAELVIDLFQDSEFCLQPPGDSPTRKSVFDSLVSGCIPVIFDPYSAYYQYTWHLPEDHERYSVYINKEDVKAKKVSVMEKLMGKTLKEREVMRSYIVHEILPGLVYGDSDAKFEKFRDAFDITIDSLFQKIKTI